MSLPWQITAAIGVVPGAEALARKSLEPLESFELARGSLGQETDEVSHIGRRLRFERQPARRALLCEQRQSINQAMGQAPPKADSGYPDSNTTGYVVLLRWGRLLLGSMSENATGYLLFEPYNRTSEPFGR